MGYIYAKPGGLCCDVCGNHPARKIPCPVNYCQAYAACKDCREKVKAFDHSSCIRRNAEMKADQEAMRSGQSTVTLYECTDQFTGAKYFRIREDRAGFAACCIFNKTWVDAPEIAQMMAWGNTVTTEGVPVHG